jgi:hypothetical protein
MEPIIPAWQRSLSVVLEILAAVHELDGRWMVVGSAATAMCGIAIQPGDIDILTRHPEDVHRIAEWLAPYAVEMTPSLNLDDFLSTPDVPAISTGDNVWTFGRWWVDGTKVECAHINLDPGEDLVRETSGEGVWRYRRLVDWNGRLVSLVALEIQAATSLSRGLEDRANVILEHLGRHGHDKELLTVALRSVGHT